MAMRLYAPSGFTQRVLLVGATRRLAPTSSLATRTLSTDWGGVAAIRHLRDRRPQIAPYT